MRVFLQALISLDPYDFAEDVAEYFVDEDENNQQTPEEVLASTLTGLPDEKLTSFALRLVLTAHKEIPRENGRDFLAEAEGVFSPPPPEKKVAVKKAGKAKSIADKPEAPPKIATKNVTASKKKIAA